jgi:hypothetical protein
VATAGTIALTATNATDGSVSSGPLMGTSVHLFALGQIAPHDVTANAGPIVLNRGNLGLNGPLPTLCGTIPARSRGS